MSPASKTLTPIDEEFVLCKACLEHFDGEHRRPKQLPCSHIYCHRCIDDFLTKRKTSGRHKVSCPICTRSWKFGANDGVQSCQRSLDLVKSHGHLLTRKNLKSKKCPDVHESDMEAFGVEKSRRTIVKRSNPLLHPPKKWTDVDFDDNNNNNNNNNNDDSDGNATKNVVSDKNSASDNFQNVGNDSMAEAPKSLQKLWNSYEAVADVNFTSEMGGRHFDQYTDGDRREATMKREVHSTIERPTSWNSVRENQSSFTFQNFKTGTADANESDDLDWNYFTQALDSPTSTLTEAAAKLKTKPGRFSNDREDNNNNNNPRNCSLTEAPFDRRYGIFSNERLLSPPLLRSAASLDLLITVGQTASEESIIHVTTTTDGIVKRSMTIKEKVNDACLVNSGNGELVVVAATAEGVKIFKGNDGTVFKLIPIGRTRFVASFHAGFVACGDSSMSFCEDLSCDLVLQSLTNIRFEDHTTAGVGGIFKKIIDVDAAGDRIGLLFRDRCIVIDRHGRVLRSMKTIDGDEEYSAKDMQLSFCASGKTLAIVNRKIQVLEVHDFLQTRGESGTASLITLELLFPRPNGKIVGGTLTKEGELIVVVQEAAGYQTYKYNIIC